MESKDFHSKFTNNYDKYKKKYKIKTFKKIMIINFVLIFVLGCTGCIKQQFPSIPTPTQSQTPASSPTQTPAVVTEISYMSREVIPSATDPAITQWDEPHYICLPEKSDHYRKILWVFLPGTGATPDYYTVLTQEAAQAGLHAICLRYPNDKSVNLQLCLRDTDVDCHEKIRTEIVTGVNVSDHVMVDRTNSIEGRLKSVIHYLHSQFPHEGWEQYLNNNEIIWSSLVIAGHSQGGGHAVYIAKEHKVHHAISFAWADVQNRELAPWLTEFSSQTPPDKYYLFWHQDDTGVANHQLELMTALTLDQFGAPVIVDGASPPYKGSHALIATIPPPHGERAHNTHVADKALIYEDGVPVYRTTWRFLMTLEFPGSGISGTFNTTETPEPTENPSPGFQSKKAVKMGSEGSYTDPEFISGENYAAFVDENRQIWLATLDPVTGAFISLDGKDIFVDDDITPLRISFNGPEFGVDSNGWALFYTKNIGTTPHIWKATIKNGNNEVTKAPLTTGDISRLSVLATKNVSSETTKLLYSSGGVLREEGQITWLDEENPDTETVVDITDVGTRWIDNTCAFTFIRMSGPDKGHIAIYDTETKIAKTITNTPGSKSYSYGWVAPEFDDILVLCVVDNSKIEIYKDTGEPYWECISTLNIPEESLYSVIGSPEPFVAGGKSYISLVIKESQGYSPAEVWVWDITQGDNHIALRCDDGQGAVIRSDPESFIGQHNVLVYYNVIRQEASGKLEFELYRWDTGITSSFNAEYQLYSDIFSHVIYIIMIYIF